MAASNAQRRPLFALGRVVATPSALDAMATSGDSTHALLMRHAFGDFGTVCESDWQANEAAITARERVLSSYLLRDGVGIWVITESDRSATTILLPEEY